jgi:hypothetical protein
VPAGGPCGGGEALNGALAVALPVALTGIGWTGPIPPLEKAERDATDNMRRIIGRIG